VVAATVVVWLIVADEVSGEEKEDEGDGGVVVEAKKGSLDGVDGADGGDDDEVEKN
jgi:hypothetical protein